MNITFSLSVSVLFGIAMHSRAQGTFVYDQRSAPDGTFGESPVDIQQFQPIGQSFTPTLSSAQFVRLYLSDSFFDGIGTTAYVNLRSDSITGTVLSSTTPVSLADRFHGPVTFLFDQPVPLTPGTQYFLQPVIQSGQSFVIAGDLNFAYGGGQAFEQGIALPNFDFWFAEGIIVPEPSTAGLLIAAGLVGVLARRLRSRN